MGVSGTYEEQVFRAIGFAPKGEPEFDPRYTNPVLGYRTGRGKDGKIPYMINRGVVKDPQCNVEWFRMMKRVED
jgi:hypothetical protein